MRIRLLPVAQAELEEAIAFYEGREPGLGDVFSEEFRLGTERILDNPKAWTVIARPLRRCLLDRFPYGILYRIDQDVIVIAAVMNLQRDPKRWRERT